MAGPGTKLPESANVLGISPTTSAALDRDLDLTEGGNGWAGVGVKDTIGFRPSEHCRAHVLSPPGQCATADNGGCDPAVQCIAKASGRECGECPDGMMGSGYARCLERTQSCNQDNGGCDALTRCEEGEGGAGPSCGECPAGYTGSGATGCVDEDGCAAEGFLGCYGMCIDAQAPRTGYTCAGCPSGLVGDGATCAPNLCYNENGGCDSMVTCTMDGSSGTRTCGEVGSAGILRFTSPFEAPRPRARAPPRVQGPTCQRQYLRWCPIGYAKLADASVSAGWRCAEVDGCAEEPCWQHESGAAQECQDVPQPGTGRVCGDCPAGFAVEAVGESGCVDVDECQAGGVNSSCWVSDIDPTQRTDCVNAPGSHSCTACPSRYIGTGEAGCRERVLCSVNNGNCDPLTSCTDNLATGYGECGPCPAGYDGNGSTTCADTDGCQQAPCFPGVECVDTPAPGDGRTCGSCPDGYRGDGIECEMCTLEVSLDPLMSTVVDGSMRRSSTNQLAATSPRLSMTDCVLTQGVRFLWTGVTSNGSKVPLDASTNMCETRTLYLPKRTLTANVAYFLQIAATLKGNANVTATAKTSFLMHSQDLVALIQGGGALGEGGGLQTGEGLPVVLDAGVSYDPDDEPGDLSFDWTCRRTDATAADAHCRRVDGELLPARMTGALLNLTLAGAPAGAEYALTCRVEKLQRSAETSTVLTIVTGSPPVPAIVPPPQKQTANKKLTLTSEVASLKPDTLNLQWGVLAQPGDASTPVNLSAVAATALDLPVLVVRPHSLIPGSVYYFTLTATDANGPSYVSLEVTPL
eukprot:gene24953-biopygen25795